MSSIGDFAENFHQTAKTIGIEAIAKINTLQIKSLPKIEDDAIIKWFMLGLDVDVHNTTIAFGVPQIDTNNILQHFSGSSYRKFIPQLIKLYQLIHDDSNAQGITFNTPTIHEGTRSFGAAKTDGNSYQIINNHSILNPTDKISIAINLYIPSGVTSGYIIHKDNSQYSLSIISDKIRWQIHNGDIRNLDIIIPHDEWFTLILSYDDSFGLRGVINNGAIETIPTLGNLSTSLTDLGIFGKSNGTSLLPAGCILSWLTIIAGEVISIPNWATQYNSKLILNLDYIGIEEITTLPYIGSISPQPNSTVGLFYVT